MRRKLQLNRSDLAGELATAIAMSGNAAYAGGANVNLTDPATGEVVALFIQFVDESAGALPSVPTQIPDLSD